MKCLMHIIYLSFILFCLQVYSLKYVTALSYHTTPYSVFIMNSLRYTTFADATQ
jgi:hypothetical protein